MPTATTSEAKEAKPKKSKRRHRVHIIEERCKGCGFCIEFCPKDVLEFSQKFNAKGYHPPQVIDHDLCTGCQMCFMLCPEFAIFIERLDEEAAGGNQETDE